MRARYARRIREGIRWGKGAALLEVALMQQPEALLDREPPTDDVLIARGYRHGVRTVVRSRQPRAYRRTWRPMAA